jgi:hypothetical protein
LWIINLFFCEGNALRDESIDIADTEGEVQAFRRPALLSCLSIFSACVCVCVCGTMITTSTTAYNGQKSYFFSHKMYEIIKYDYRNNHQ